jgi:hypothetical protein
MASIVGICNSALIKAGAEPILSLTENSKAARLCNEQYEKLRDEVLRAHPWNFAIHRVCLARLSVSPSFEFAYQYQLPSDCLRVLRMAFAGSTFKIEGRSLLTDEPTAKILYIRRELDPQRFDSQFREALAYRIAADLAFPLAASTTLSQALWRLYEQQLATARSMDGQEGTPDNLQADAWINSRI